MGVLVICVIVFTVFCIDHTVVFCIVSYMCILICFVCAGLRTTATE